jgi:thiamine biosynthesis lipoprotein
MKKSAVFLTVLICLLLLAATGCRRNTAGGYRQVERSEFLMGTLVTIKIYDEDSDRGNSAADRALERIREIEGLMSANLESSEVGVINREAGTKPVAVSKDTFSVIEKGLYYGNLSGGLFDITVEPLVKLWGIGTQSAGIPDRAELESALGLVDYKKVDLGGDTREVFLKEPGMGLDLGGIAKGYAADEAKKILVSEGIEHAIINLGGNIQTVGLKFDGTPWNIGIKDPEDPAGALLGVARINDSTVVTSGDYERYFEEDGKRYHHILDPYTGYPGRGEMRAVTILTSSSFDADALSTSVFLMGIERGMELIEILDGVEAIAVTRDRQVVTSSGVGDAFSILKGNYKMR